MTGVIELDMMAVDADYRRHGIATKRMEYGMEISRRDNVTIGTLAAESGLPLYRALGFRVVDQTELQDDRPGHEARLIVYVCMWSLEESTAM